MTYKTFKITIEGAKELKTIEVAAVDFDAAWADVCQAFDGAALVQWGVK